MRADVKKVDEMPSMTSSTVVEEKSWLKKKEDNSEAPVEKVSSSE